MDHKSLLLSPGSERVEIASRFLNVRHTNSERRTAGEQEYFVPVIFCEAITKEKDHRNAQAECSEQVQNSQPMTFLGFVFWSIKKWNNKKPCSFFTICLAPPIYELSLASQFQSPSMFCSSLRHIQILSA